MDSDIAGNIFQFAGIFIEAALVLYVVWSRQWKGQGGVPLYLTALLCAHSRGPMCFSNLARPWREYFYVTGLPTAPW